MVEKRETTSQLLQARIKRFSRVEKAFYLSIAITALVLAICFTVSSIFSPLLAIVPTAATAPILIIVGIMMLSSLKNIHWDDMAEAVPAFFTSIFMGFSYSITNGIAAGFITYTVTKLVKGEAKEVHSMIWILDALFILNFISMALH